MNKSNIAQTAIFTLSAACLPINMSSYAINESDGDGISFSEFCDREKDEIKVACVCFIGAAALAIPEETAFNSNWHAFGKGVFDLPAFDRSRHAAFIASTHWAREDGTNTNSQAARRALWLLENAETWHDTVPGVEEFSENDIDFSKLYHTDLTDDEVVARLTKFL
jgi:hypothetical protein